MTVTRDVFTFFFSLGQIVTFLLTGMGFWETVFGAKGIHC